MNSKKFEAPGRGMNALATSAQASLVVQEIGHVSLVVPSCLYSVDALANSVPAEQPVPAARLLLPVFTPLPATISSPALVGAKLLTVDVVPVPVPLAALSKTVAFVMLPPLNSSIVMRMGDLHARKSLVAKLQVVSISGAQGTGKTSLARALAARLEACVLSRDPLMAVLLEGGLPVAGLEEPGIKDVGLLGYELQSAILGEQLEVGRSVVIECVASPTVRDSWRLIAEQAGASFFAIETTCSDPELHRSRFQQRGQGSVGDWELRWANVQQTMWWYEPHPSAVFVADSAVRLNDNVEAILETIGQ
jgi:predicted kinase